MKPHEFDVKSYESDIKIIKSAWIIGIATLGSRILGFVRDAAVAMILGAGLYSDAFFAAFRIPDLFRKLFSDGALSISFIPIFTELLTLKGKKDAFDMARSVLAWIAFLGIFFLSSVFLGAFAWAYFFTEFPPRPSEFNLALLLSKIMMPYVLCVSLTAVFMGILNSMGHFAVPAMAPMLFNVIMIVVALAVAPRFDQPAVPMAWAVMAGGIVQLGVQIPFILKKGFAFRGRLRLYHPATVKAFKMMLPAMVGLSAYQVNLFVCTCMASFLPEGSISYLYYADRLVQFPLALFAGSIATSFFPELAKEVASGNPVQAAGFFVRGARMLLFIIIPSMAGLTALREPIAALLFYQGAFDISDVQATANVLLFFCTGLWAFSGIRFFVPLFYTISNVKIPFTGAVISMAVNLFLSVILMKSMGTSGLALSISIAAMFNFLFLLKGVSGTLFRFSWKEIMGTACRSSFISAIMFFLVYKAAQYLCPSDAFTSKAAMTFGVFFSVLTGVSVYTGLAYFLRFPEVSMIFNILKKIRNRV